jgi:hypothetical protein
VIPPENRSQHVIFRHELVIEAMQAACNRVKRRMERGCDVDHSRSFCAMGMGFEQRISVRGR